jgi:hypothetical protein
MSQQTTYDYCIVGFGIAGQLLVLELLKAGVSPSTISICDETFLGGALATHYSSVLSNTPWWKTRKALEAYPLWSQDSIQEGDALYTLEQCMPVGDIARLCCKTAWTAAHTVEKLYGCVTSLQHSGTLWNLQTTAGLLQANTVFLCQGGTPTTVDVAIPKIPLELALNQETLKRLVTPKDRVVVVGTAHSGTIILNNLHQLGIPVTGLYRTPTPFVFARDGAYDGIKEGSEQIADSILAGKLSNVSLVSCSNPFEVYKVLQKATKIISATGFQARCPFGPEFCTYNPATALLSAGPNLAGFGIAYPGKTEIAGKQYVDVSVLSFQEQIQRCLPALLQINKTDNK